MNLQRRQRKSAMLRPKQMIQFTAYTGHDVKGSTVYFLPLASCIIGWAIIDLTIDKVHSIHRDRYHTFMVPHASWHVTSWSCTAPQIDVYKQIDVTLVFFTWNAWLRASCGVKGVKCGMLTRSWKKLKINSYMPQTTYSSKTLVRAFQRACLFLFEKSRDLRQ